MRDIFSFFEKPKEAAVFNALRISIASPQDHPRVVVWRGQEPGDDQLPYVQART